MGVTDSATNDLIGLVMSTARITVLPMFLFESCFVGKMFIYRRFFFESIFSKIV